MSLYDHCLADLKARFGPDAFLLTPQQIAPIIKRTAEVQANQRATDKKNEGTGKRKLFPLPVKKEGRGVYVSIYHLAEWIATGDCSATEIESLPEADKEEQPAKVKAAAPAAQKMKVKKVGEFDDILWLAQWQNSINFQIQLYAEVEKLLLTETVPDKPNRTKRPLPSDRFRS